METKNLRQYFQNEYKKAYKGILPQDIINQSNPWFEAFLQLTVNTVCDEIISKYTNYIPEPQREGVEAKIKRLKSDF